MILALDCIATVAIHATVGRNGEAASDIGYVALGFGGGIRGNGQWRSYCTSRPVDLWRWQLSARIVGVIVGRRHMSGVFSVSSVVARDPTAAKSNAPGVYGKVGARREGRRGPCGYFWCPSAGAEMPGRMGVADFKCWALTKGSASICELADSIGDIQRRKEEMGSMRLCPHIPMALREWRETLGDLQLLWQDNVYCSERQWFEIVYPYPYPANPYPKPLRVFPTPGNP
ncbi:hypothetical protein EDB86DRAFT_2829978 [Lactarius hatsudake]|nr:hypothetical protein EDB86DRAFT_2829978 [Lactarius hatsudake]